MAFKFLLVLMMSIAVAVQGQSIDKSFCDPATIVTAMPQIPFPIPTNPTIQYALNFEINSDLSKSTVEMDQWFDGLLNRAINIIRKDGIEIKIYNFDATNEVIVVSNDLCEVGKASETSFPVPSIALNGSEHIISPLLLLQLQNPDLKELYIGKSVVKGIQVLQWQMCNFIQATQATQRVTYSISDPTAWTVAVPFGNVSAVPVEVKVENKLPNGTQWNDLYSITKFRPGIITRDEFWTTPDGVFCPGRQLGKRPPKVPKAFTFRAQIVAPLPGLDDLVGEITGIREVYDYPNKMFRMDYSRKSSPITEIHDYKTGLRYIIDKFRGNCTLATVDPDAIEAQTVGGFVTLKNQTGFFDFDSTEFQYTGQKHVDHINCDVWIGKKMMFNTTTTWEWYFMADGYIQQAPTEAQVNEPVLLIITFYQVFFNNITNKPDYRKVPVYYYFYDFDESGLDTFMFDVTPCFDKYPKRHFLFDLPDEYRDLMQQYKTNLKLGVLIGITTSTAVYPLRVSDLEIDFNQDNIVVVFTLLEKSPFYGNVQMTLPEVQLSDAVALLNVTIATGKLYVPFIVDNTTFFELVALPRSLREIESRGAGLIYISKETIKQVGYSGGQVGGIAFGILVLGLVIGLVGGVFFCIMRPNALPMETINNLSPIDKIQGFINPMFKKGASADA